MSDRHQAKWSNWSGFQMSNPQQILQPANIQELQNIVRDHDKIDGWCRAFIHALGVY